METVRLIHCLKNNLVMHTLKQKTAGLGGGYYVTLCNNVR